MKKEFVIGVDVGTASVRAGIFDLLGRMVGYSAKEISIWRPQEYFVEQSSREIWSAACGAVRAALKNGKVDPARVAGISFDATCSLVALGENDEPVTISPSGDPERNVIVWMDHRGLKQAERINLTGHPALKYVGGKISPEMEPPKLLWVKENLPKSWKLASKFLDLADFMTYKSAGVDARSICTTVCKWTYRGYENKWDESFFDLVGLSKLLDKKMVGKSVVPMGTCLGNLTQVSAADLGLMKGTKVAAGIIDAHAGGIGVFGMGFDSPLQPKQFEKILALIGGTSSCHMVVSRKPRFIKGVWGPYYGAMIPGMWLNEGGQSATGSLLDFMIRNNSRYEAIQREAKRKRLTVYEYLNGVISDLKKLERKGPEIVKDIHMLPYFLGNRSPRADPSARGVISGMTLDEGTDTLARLYYATIQAIAFGTRHIIEEMNRSGYNIGRIHACGGGTKNSLWLQEHANITGCEIILPREPEAVLVGTAVIAAVGAGKYGSIAEGMIKMSSIGKSIIPDIKSISYYQAKFGIFKEMYADFKKIRERLEKF